MLLFFEKTRSMVNGNRHCSSLAEVSNFFQNELERPHQLKKAYDSGQDMVWNIGFEEEDITN